MLYRRRAFMRFVCLYVAILQVSDAQVLKNYSVYGRSIESLPTTTNSISFGAALIDVLFLVKRLEKSIFGTVDSEYQFPVPERWVAQTGGRMPSNPVFAGLDGQNPVYVARAYVGGFYLSTGKIIEGQSHAHVPLDGNEHTFDSYDVLSASPEVLSWVRSGNGQGVPVGAIETGGRSASGARMYVGRAVHEGNVIPGNVVDGWLCYVSYGGKQYSKTEYEVLVKNMYGVQIMYTG